MHNDRILIRLLKSNGRSKEGEVVRILDRANKTVVGTFEKDKNFGYVVPDDRRIYQDIFVPKDEIKDVKNGYKVVAEIVRWPQKRRNPEGRIIEVLGHKDDVGTDILSIIRQFNLPEEFRSKCCSLQERSHKPFPRKKLKTKGFAQSWVITRRSDAKDLDDGISIEKNKRATLFWESILLMSAIMLRRTEQSTGRHMQGDQCIPGRPCDSHAAKGIVQWCLQPQSQ